MLMRKNINGENHGDVATSCNKLGNDYCALGQQSQSKEYSEKALIMRRNIYGEHHGDVAASYNNLGNVYWILGQYSQAAEHFQKSLNI